MKATLVDIAKATGFSINTVSRAVNGKSAVNEKTREKILKCANELGYYPNMMAKTIRGSENGLIGTLVSSISDHFFVSLLGGIEEETTRRSMSILIQNADEDSDKQLNGLRTLLSYGCSNIIVSPVQQNAKVMELLDSSKVNYVIADRVFSSMGNCHRVSINNFGDSERIVEYLLCCGHRKIAILNQKSQIDTETDRTKGYKSALQNKRIEVRKDYILLCSNETDVKDKIINLMQNAERPTALFIAKDTLALSAICTIQKLGIRIPEDLSIFIYGDPEWASMLHPSIHGMSRPVRDVGRIAVRMLLDGMTEGQDRKEIVLNSSLIIRNSVRIL